MGEINPWYWNKINLFDHVAPEGRQAFLQRSERREYRRGEHIFRAHDPANRVFFLESGLAKIYYLSQRGALTIFWFCVPGDLFGAGGITGSLEQSVYGQAVDRSAVYAISRTAFEEVLHAHPQIALNVIKLMGARLRLACDAMTDRVTQKTDARLARVLLRLARNWGDITPAGVRFRVRISDQELANMIGASRQTVNRVLGEFNSAGWVGRDGRTLILRDAVGLNELLARADRDDTARSTTKRAHFRFESRRW
ncbi:MAG: Crp/Fnr family transcriptional regulator [Burkholderiales bacterium]|nr:Crp/Fnr family transcriptional regulator [Burkholderiales bacterium]